MTDNKKFIIGSRGSKLSLAYSSHVKDLLLKSNSQFDRDKRRTLVLIMIAIGMSKLEALQNVSS